jgi:hypothetical protein
MTEVSKAEGCELDFHGTGAFAWWAAQADSEEVFLRKLQGALGYYKLILIDVSKIRQFSQSDEVKDEFYEMVECVRENESWVLFGSFHTYPHHDA